MPKILPEVLLDNAEDEHRRDALLFGLWTDTVIPVEVVEPSLRYSMRVDRGTTKVEGQELDEVEERDMTYIKMIAQNNK